MTKDELNEKFAFAGINGICQKCTYLNNCNRILPGYVKPNKCGGPFYKEMK